MTQETEFKTVSVTITEEQEGARLDQAIAALLPEYSRVFLQKLVKDSLVKVNGVVCDVAKTKMRNGNLVDIQVPLEKKLELLAEKIDLDVIYEDEDMIVINKPAGLVVHPAAGNWSGTVVNALLGRDEHFAEGMDDELEELRPGIVHRLDKDTSGCLVIAKNQHSLMKLSMAFAERKVKKTYAVLVYGWPKLMKEQIMTKMGRHPVNRKKMTVLERGGKAALSVYEVLEAGKIDRYPVSFLQVRILTGRTHQIRVHMAYKKIPVLGDTLYGGNQKIEAPRQMLHSWKISFPHPTDGREMSFIAPLPKDFEKLRKKIVPLSEE